jgi:ATPase subunit of ABC transporter with duplicated ATPase domains
MLLFIHERYAHLNVSPGACCPLQHLELGVDCDSRIALVGPNGAGEVAAWARSCATSGSDDNAENAMDTATYG